MNFILHFFIITLLIDNLYPMDSNTPTAEICIGENDQFTFDYDLPLNRIIASKTLAHMREDVMDSGEPLYLIDNVQADDFDKYFMTNVGDMAVLNNNKVTQSEKNAAKSSLRKSLLAISNDNIELLKAANISNFLETPLLPLIEDIIATKINTQDAVDFFSQLPLGIQNNISRKKLAEVFGYLEAAHIKLRTNITASNAAVGHIMSVAYKPDGTQLASGSHDTTIKIWDANTGHLLNTLPGHQKPVGSVTYNQNGTQLASISTDKTIKIWDANTGHLLNTLPGHQGTVRSIAYKPDGTQLASGSTDKTIKIWDANTGHLLNTLPGHKEAVRSIAYKPDGTQLASGSHDTTIKIWDANTGHLLNTLPGHKGTVDSIAYKPDGTQLASGSIDKTIKIWDANTGHLLNTLPGHKEFVNSITYNPNGTQLASGSHDKTIKIWDANTGHLLNTLPGHQGAVDSIVYNPNGTQLASGSHDKTIKIWDTEVVIPQNDVLTLAFANVIATAYTNRLNNNTRAICLECEKMPNLSTKMQQFLQPLLQFILCTQHQVDVQSCDKKRKADSTLEHISKKLKDTPD